MLIAYLWQSFLDIVLSHHIIRIPHSIPWGHPVSLSGKNVGKIISYRENLALAILRLPNL